MYAAHNKDINRHKSFHPLTHRNLSKVEQRKAKDDAKSAADAERGVQLRHDQEERRYDELLRSAGDAGGVGSQLAKYRQVENIFAAEAQTRQVAPKSSATPRENGEREEDFRVGMEKATRHTAHKREREATEKENGADHANRDGKGVMTGYVSLSAAAQMRRELDTLQKSRHDPLRRIEKFQNRTVAAEARRRELQGKSVKGEDNEKDAIRSRIQELLDMKKR